MDNKLMTAKSYRHGIIIKQYEKSGKPYATVKLKCERCVNGVFPAGIENGQIKPHPNANGVCFACGGIGYTTKDVRLYTEKELANMEEANEKAKAKRQIDLEERMKKEFADNKKKWLLDNGFNENETTWIVTGDSYSIKDKLKEAGFYYSPVLRWHKATKDEKYTNRLIEVKLSDVAEWSAWGQAHFTSKAKDYIDNLLAAAQPKSTSEWIGEVGDKLKDLPVQLVKKYSFDGKYGTTTVYTFQTKEGNLLTWFSSTFQPYDIGEWMKIKYTTIKDHNEYKGVKSTIITRTKLVNIEPAQEVYDEYNWENENLNG